MRSRVVIPSAIVAVGVALLAGCAPSGPGVDRIDELTFHQQQAIPNFDDSEYVQRDADQVARFVKLLDKDGIDPASYHGRDTGGCVGGLSTEVTIGYRDSKLATQLDIDSCGQSKGFESDANALFSEWRGQPHRE